MSDHHATVAWKRQTGSFRYEDYNRDHTWTFENGLVVEASSAPRFLGSADRVDPEEAFVASISACHMLTFLAICARRRIIVDRYDDEAVGHLEPNAEKKLAITRVELHPRVTFAEGHEPTPEALSVIHERSHRECFIANSVTTEITVSG
jgi:organic hydroperoxide reductase OsmC/OhrA